MILLKEHKDIMTKTIESWGLRWKVYNDTVVAVMNNCKITNSFVGVGNGDCGTAINYSNKRGEILDHSYFPLYPSYYGVYDPYFSFYR